MWQLANHQLKGVEGRNHRRTQSAGFAWFYVTGQKVFAVIGRIGKPFGGRVYEHRRQPSRPEHAAHHSSTHNAEHDFFRSRDGDFEHV